MNTLEKNVSALPYIYKIVPNSTQLSINTGVKTFV